MGLAPKLDNPFQPGAGARPPLLAGRARELTLATRLLDSLDRGRLPPGGLLLFGPRGNGKTVLLARVAKEARRRGMRAEHLPASSFRDRETLLDELQESAGLRGARLSGAQVAGFGVATRPGHPRGTRRRCWTGGSERPPHRW